jgi:hypothetical protein
MADGPLALVRHMAAILDELSAELEEAVTQTSPADRPGPEEEARP